MMTTMERSAGRGAGEMWTEGHRTRHEARLKGVASWRTAYGWFRRWREQGLFDALLRHAAKLRQRAGGCKAESRLAVIDMQSVRLAFRAAKAPAIPVRGSHGFDAAKKVLGRKRVVLVDAELHRTLQPW